MPDRIPPHQTVTSGFPVLHAGSVPRMPGPRDWRFAIRGLVRRPRILTWEDMLALPRVRITADIHCVTGWSKLDVTWEGVPTRAVHALAGADPRACCVMVHGANDFSANLTLEDFLAPGCLFAIAVDGRPLSPEHGGPMRLVVPQLYFWKSAKWVTGLEYLAEERPGFWEERGYHLHGDPWKEERYW
ncbi:Uncharacterized oxidoreductase YuiH [Candidatus Hydrogenisulfobacillus filiaventi]|uniref:Uncharacterized oxidoreductase YuiH n=1 Tax=Candidatus Hydrogenisulfobacillus filiaventi TaxID=2707344 RepID=A0A6F8ZFD4_9FIRM|nr:Uncharacterized oxidoreductase YuiH [Candidatus Hydrogenisulfobacillus filiaventi]